MRLALLRPYNSLTSDLVADEDLSDFIVLSGPNGSGKSQLLEGISSGAIAVDGESFQAGHPGVRLFLLAQLVATVEGPQTPAAMKDRWVSVHQQVESWIQQFMQPPNNLARGSEEMEQTVRSQLVASRQLSAAAVDRLASQTGKRIVDLVVDDYRVHAPLLPGIRDPFTMGVAEVFLSYHARRQQNRFHQWLQATKPDYDGAPLTDEEFVQLYGPPPWDLLNGVLREIGMGYTFIAPTGDEDTLQYEAELIHDASAARVKAVQLSAGEKTLLAIAMSLYTGERHGDAIELPKVLLLDETDASLHPAMVQSLVRVVGRTFVGEYGVRVILTTHSPSTVALAPEEAIYVMRRSDYPRLVKVSRDEALRSLTVGIPTLSVHVENRRQVFVESEYDAECYQELYRLARDGLKSPFTLEFIPSGRGGSGGEVAVRDLVRALRATGNVYVYGIVDRDSRTAAGEGIRFNAARDSLENLVFDPVVVGAFLLRERFIRADELGLPHNFRYFDVGPETAQAIAEHAVERATPNVDPSDTREVTYRGGFRARIAAGYLDLDGHELEARLTDAFPPLRRYGKQLKMRVVDLVLADAPDLIPSEVEDLFASVVEGS
jgi:energy-coupling factor transporter ATP-binding protein EcfA2